MVPEQSLESVLQSARYAGAKEKLKAKTARLSFIKCANPAGAKALL
jgi:hypothetical protein